MDAKQIKDEIRRLNQVDKIEIYRWIGVQIHAIDLLSGVGVYRSLPNGERTRQSCRVIS
jgi:hypothetical protein